MWGSAAAKPVTLSFRVKCSIPGTYSGALRSGNSGGTYRACTFTYTVTIADTWQDFSITLPGDPNQARYNLGTENELGLSVVFDLGSGNGYRTPTLGSWVPGNFIGHTSGLDMGTTLNATFHLTNVQLEAGSIATPFERRPYSLELQLCKRYFQWIPFNMLFYAYQNGEALELAYPFPVEMRVTPTIPVITPDPVVTPQFLNSSVSTIIRANTRSCSTYLAASSTGTTYVVGYRGGLSAEI
jgi:hypothetical protein